MQKSRKSKIYLACALACLIGNPATANVTVAKKGAHTVSVSDVLAAIELLPTTQRESIRNDKVQWRPVVEEILTVREWRKSDLYRSLTPEEKAAVEYRASKEELKAGIDALVNREIARLAQQPQAVELRAREIWLADTTRFFSSDSADVAILFIDAGKRGLAGATARYREVQKRLARGESLESIAPKLGDVVPGQKEPLPPRMTVERRKIDAAARREIFTKLKPGQISGPIPAPEGWLVVRLIAKNPPQKLPFDEVKAGLMEGILQESAATARLTLMAKLTETPIEFSAELTQPQASAERMREAALAAEQVQKELRDRKITAEQVESRLRELLALPAATDNSNKPQRSEGGSSTPK